MMQFINTSILFGLKIVATLASGIGKKKKLFILIYHRVLDKPDFMRPGEVDVATFNWQMELLSKYFNVLPLDDALEKIKTGNLPPRAVCITFDDGYADNLNNATPILKQYGLKATFFIASGYLDGGRMWNDSVIEAIRLMPEQQLDLTDINLNVYNLNDNQKKMEAAYKIINKIKYLEFDQREKFAQHITSFVPDLPDDLMLTSDQLIELNDHGMEIGGHTVNHPILANLERDLMNREIKENKLELEKLLKKEIRFFAYPNGKPGQDYLPEQSEAIKEFGYEAALSTKWGVSNSESDYWQLPRFTPWDKSPEKFMARMTIKFSEF